MVDESTEGGAPPNGGKGTRNTEVSIPPIAKTRLLRSRRQVYMQIVAATVILICGIVIGSGVTLQRLKPNIAPGPMPPPWRIADDMQERYGLTEEQTEKVKTALKDSSERMRKLFEEFRPKMDAEFKEFSAAIEDILTSEQFKQWERDFKSKRGRGPGRFGSRRPGGPGRPDGFHGPGPGGRSGPGGPDPNRRSGQYRRDYSRYGPRQRGPAEPNAIDE